MTLRMRLQILPNELLLLIASGLEREAHINALAQVNHHFHNTLNLYLYKRNAANSNSSALKHAVCNGRIPTARKALQAGANVNAVHDDHPLICDAARSGSTEMFNLLLISGVDFTVKDLFSRSSLANAAEYGHAEIVKILLGKGMDPNARDYWYRTPLYAACSEGRAAVVDTLLANEATDRESDAWLRFTPLHEAAQKGHAGIVTALLAHGADANSVAGKYIDTQASLSDPIICRQPEVLKLLVGRDGVDPNEVFRETTVLQTAVLEGCEDMVGLLLSDRRINPDLTFLEDKRTPLLMALVNNNYGIVKALLDAGADRDIKDSMGLSPAMLLQALHAEARNELLQRYPLPDSSGNTGCLLS